LKNTLHELDHEQYLVLNQAKIEKERLERDKYKFKLLFKQKQIEVNELEQKILEKMRNKHNQQVKFENIPNRDIELEQNYDYQVKLRDKNRAEV
jgi:S-adenosylmethionine:tRNA-ribosyltransferase-isomerase (queuine synthetase)